MRKWREKTGKEKFKTGGFFFLLLMGLLYLLVSPIELASFVATIILLIYMELRIRRRRIPERKPKEYKEY